MPLDLFNFFNPKSLAVIGVSRNPSKVGTIVVNNIISNGYSGKIYPINPNTDSVLNLKCYPNLKSLPEAPELVLVSLPASSSVSVLQEIAEAGVKNVVIFASGFKEVGSAGEGLENQLIQISSKYQLNILGPNCLGFVNNNLNLNATFGASSNFPGKIKFISQSGAISASIFDWSLKNKIGINEFITIGNKSVITEIDVLNYFLIQSEKEGVDSNFPIGMYLESISNGPEFIKLCSKLSKNHPIFILKPGKTKEATVAMKSHTGSLAGEDDVLTASLHKSGVIRCNNLNEFFIATKSFSLLPYAKSENITVISNAGGPGVLTADSIVESGLSLTQSPIDLLGDALANKYLETGAKSLLDKNTDSILFLLTPQTMTEIDKTAQAISAMANQHKKVIVSAFIGGERVSSGIKFFIDNHTPAFEFPEMAIQALSFINKFYKYKNRDVISANYTIENQQIEKINEIINNSKNDISLDNLTADQIVNGLGIKIPESIYLDNEDSALIFARKFNFQVILKVSANGLLHKKDVGGIISVYNEEGLKSGIQNLRSKFPNDKIQIQQKVSSGLEIICGFKYDEVFGPILLYGIGGSFVEIIKDKNIINLPASSSEIENSIKYSKISQIASKEKMDLSSLATTLYNFSKLANKNINIKEGEINPLIINNDGIWAVDTKIILPTIIKESN